MIDDLTDYKFYCFEGEPKFCQVITDRTVNERINFYDNDWNVLNIKGFGLPYKERAYFIKQPSNYKKMIKLAKEFAKGIHFLRVDFYEIQKKYYFGEFTFFPASGFGSFFPDAYNASFGEMIKIVGK